jgi:nucleoside-diphosphate-sugar epimerase
MDNKQARVEQQTGQRRMKLLVTGGHGFVGSRVLAALQQAGLTAAGSVRQAPSGATAYLAIGCLNGQTDWSTATKGVDCVVHTAARVHMVKDSAADSLAEFRKVNVQGTLNLARQAATAGVRRLVFISSVKVHGEITALGAPFSADDVLAPLDAYGISKREAEQGLRDMAINTGMEVVIIRPPLVYGPGVKANFQAMMHWLSRGIPLPLGAIHNQRSLVALDNLVDLIVTCTHHPAAANQSFLVSDGEDLSTTQLLRRMGQAMGRPARLIPVPPALLQAGAALLGKPELAQRLCGSLQVDTTKTRHLLGWKPPMSVDEGLRRAAQGFSA